MKALSKNFETVRLSDPQLLSETVKQLQIPDLTRYNFIYACVSGENGGVRADYGSLFIPVEVLKLKTTYSTISCFASTDYYTTGRVGYQSDDTLLISRAATKGWDKIYLHLYGIKKIIN